MAPMAATRSAAGSVVSAASTRTKAAWGAAVSGGRPVTRQTLPAQELGPGVAVAQHPQPAGVGGDGPADGGPVPAGDVDAVGPAGGGRHPPHRGQAGARARRHLAPDVVDGADAVEVA